MPSDRTTHGTEDVAQLRARINQSREQLIDQILKSAELIEESRRLMAKIGPLLRK
jgi:hypothetical protein